jgi:hypothetical protein
VRPARLQREAADGHCIQGALGAALLPHLLLEAARAGSRARRTAVGVRAAPLGRQEARARGVPVARARRRMTPQPR